MKQKIVKVLSPNRMLFIRGKLSRTPLELIIKFDNELEPLRASMIHQGINFTVEDYVPTPKKEKVVIKNIVSKTKETPKPKMVSPKSTLEKLSVEDGE